MASAEIHFAPICSNCGNVIFEEINFIGDETFYSDNRVICNMNHTIVPHKCPKCGHIFTRIIMPCKLPYTYENLKLKKATLNCKGCLYDDGTFHSFCTVCTRSNPDDGEDDYYEPTRKESK